jgi:hypothetical protein
MADEDQESEVERDRRLIERAGLVPGGGAGFANRAIAELIVSLKTALVPAEVYQLAHRADPPAHAVAPLVHGHDRSHDGSSDPDRAEVCRPMIAWLRRQLEGLGKGDK